MRYYLKKSPMFRAIQVPERYTLEMREFEERTYQLTVLYKTIGTAITPDIAHVAIGFVDEPVQAYPGDWLVEDLTGEISRMTHTEFRAVYDEVEA